MERRARLRWRLTKVVFGRGVEPEEVGRFASLEEAQAAAQNRETLEWNAPGPGIQSYTSVGRAGVWIAEPK